MPDVQTSTTPATYLIPEVDDFDVAVMRELEPAYRIYRAGQGARQTLIDNDLTSLNRDHPGRSYPGHIRGFRDWLGQHPEHHPVTVYDGPAIGPETPGWSEFWAQLLTHAEEEGYEEQYNILAAAFGATQTEDDTEQDYCVQVTIPSFTVHMHRTVRTAEVRDSGSNAFEFDSSEIDDAIREHIAETVMEWEVDEYEES